MKQKKKWNIFIEALKKYKLRLLTLEENFKNKKPLDDYPYEEDIKQTKDFITCITECGQRMSYLK